MSRIFKKAAALMLSVALSAGLCSMLPGPGTVRAAYTDYVYDTGVSIPLDQETEVTVGGRKDIFEEYYAFSFRTGTQKADYSLIWGENTSGTRPELFITTELSRDTSLAVYHNFSISDKNDFGSISGKGKALSPDTTYYILLQGGTASDSKSSYTAKITIKTTSYTSTGSDSGAGSSSSASGNAANITVLEGDVAGQELELLQPAKVTVKQADSYGQYTVFPFKTGVLKAYYNVFWSSTEKEEVSYRIYTSSESKTDNLKSSGYIKGYDEIGSVLGLGKKLEPDTTYYLMLERDKDKDYSGTLTVKYVMDEEADKVSLADPVIPGTTKYGSIDGNEDRDVFYLETGKDSYSLTVDCEANILFSIYKDSLLGNKIYPTPEVGSTKVSDIDLTDTLEKDHTYYIVVDHWTDTKGDQVGYEFIFKKKSGGSSSDGSSSGSGSDTGSSSSSGSGSGSSSGSSSSKTTTNAKYYKKIKNSKSYITNMGSNVKVSFKSGKVTLKKGSYGFLCKKSKAKKYVFTKASELKKKKYTYKLAKGCKIVYGSNFYSNTKIKETTKTKSWVKKQFKNGGGGNSIGLCLNKKNRVTMIYVSGFDVYAEQI